MNTFAYTTCLLSGGLDTKDNFSKGGIAEERLRNTALEIDANDTWQKRIAVRSNNGPPL